MRSSPLRRLEALGTFSHPRHRCGDSHAVKIPAIVAVRSNVRGRNKSIFLRLVFCPPS